MPSAAAAIEAPSVTDLDALFKGFADPTRIRILSALAAGELCVCDIVELLDLPQPTVSRHLAYLRRNGLVATSQQGPWRVYALVDPAPPALTANLACLQDARATEPQFARDLERLAHLSTQIDCGCATPAVPRRRILRLTRR